MDPRLSVEKRKQGLQCPTCGAELAIHLGVRLEAAEEREAIAEAVARLDGESQQIVDAAKATDLFAAFVAVVERTLQGQRPKDMERFFVTFLRTATPRHIPRFAVDRINAMFACRRFDYWAAQQLGMVVVEGHIRLFLPNELLRGTAVRRLAKGTVTGGARHMDIAAAPERLEEWIRTRWGYVSQQGPLLQVLRRKSIGEFALPGI